MRAFEKPAKQNCDLITEWKKRGLIIPDISKAKRYLNFISYYRLSAYTIPFQTLASEHQFKANVAFDDVLQLYIFDRELRLLVMDAIERIEVAVRAQISNTLALSQADGDSSNPFWYTDPQHFKFQFAHMKFLSDIEKKCLEERTKLEQDLRKIKEKKLNVEDEKHRIENAQKENFLRHYLSQYDTPRLPPCWMMMELLTLGQLSHLYSNLTSHKIKKEIAQNLGVNAEILVSWLRSLNSIRNICAHHGRLWNRELGVSIKIPTSKQVKWLDGTPSLPHDIDYRRRIYSILVAMQTILYTISPYSSWAKRLQYLLNEKYPKISKPNMGIPVDWQNDTFWNNALNR